LIYCRSREKTLQITALLAGLTFSICGRVAGQDPSLQAVWWIGSQFQPGDGQLFWLLKLWLQWGLLILSPALLVLMGRAVSLKRAV
jgi:hypothetical protein